MLQTRWTFRDELIYLSQRWPWLVLAFLAGALLGWGIARILPAGYEAQTEFFVSYNGDLLPRNPDDYKNWQMEELEGFLLTGPVLAEAADQLKQQNENFAAVTPEDLAERLELRWRNAGTWTLAVRASRAEEAQAIAQAWQAAALSSLTTAAEHARNVVELERGINQTASLLYATRARLETLEQASETLSDWQAQFAAASASPLTALQAWDLNLLAGQALSGHPTAAEMLSSLPQAGATPQAVRDVLPQITAAVEQQHASLASRAASLQAQWEALSAEWQAETAAARGITAYLTIEPLREGQIQVESIDAGGAAALVGGLVGLLGFILVRLIRWSRP